MNLIMDVYILYITITKPILFLKKPTKKLNKPKHKPITYIIYSKTH